MPIAPAVRSTPDAAAHTHGLDARRAQQALAVPLTDALIHKQDRAK